MHNSLLIIRRGLLVGAMALASLLAPLPVAAGSIPVEVLAAGAQGSLADLVANLMPSVVNVTTKRLVQPPTNALNASSKVESNDATSSTSVGSGFVIDPSGLIVTNNHVVEGAYDVSATFNDGTVLHAEVVATTKIGDLALIKVNSTHRLQALRWGDSTALRVGDPVVAIGNPLGFGGSVSTGIISALNRDIMLSPFDDFIQTDAALNHGNSGGPLFNLRGEVIGVTTALYTPLEAGGSIGIGFAIPAFCANFVVGQLQKYGIVRSGELGVQLQDATAEIAQATGLPPTSRTAGILPGSAGWGVIVTNVLPDGPAARAGIRDGDILLKIDGEPIGDTRAFARTVAIHELDKPVTVALWRNGEPMTVTPVVREWLSGQEVDGAALRRSRPVRSAAADLGLRLTPLTDPARIARDLPAGQPGVLVQNVVAGSIAGERGLGSGDVIIKVMDRAVTAPEDVLNGLRDMWDQNRAMVMLLVRGNNGLRWVPLPSPLMKMP